jgi:hypothetical protein
MVHASRAVELLEPRRLLSSDAAAPAETEADLPVIEYTSDVVIAEGRQQIYPPLAPAGWTDESVGSFEEPEAITVAFFPPDPIDETPVEDAANHVPPPALDVSDDGTVAAAARTTSIAREVLGDEDDGSLVE